MRRTCDSFADACFAIDARLRRARRAFSVDPPVKRSTDAADAFSRRNPRVRARSPTSLRAIHESVRESTPAMDVASLTSATRTTALSRAPLRASGRGALCRRGARENRSFTGGGSFTEESESFKFGHRSSDRRPIDRPKIGFGRWKISTARLRAIHGVGARRTEAFQPALIHPYLLFRSSASVRDEDARSPSRPRSQETVSRRILAFCSSASHRS